MHVTLLIFGVRSPYLVPGRTMQNVFVFWSHSATIKVSHCYNYRVDYCSHSVFFRRVTRRNPRNSAGCPAPLNCSAGCPFRRVPRRQNTLWSTGIHPACTWMSTPRGRSASRNQQDGCCRAKERMMTVLGTAGGSSYYTT